MRWETEKLQFGGKFKDQVSTFGVVGHECTMNDRITVIQSWFRFLIFVLSSHHTWEETFNPRLLLLLFLFVIDGAHLSFESFTSFSLYFMGAKLEVKSPQILVYDHVTNFVFFRFVFLLLDPLYQVFEHGNVVVKCRQRWVTIEVRKKHLLFDLLDGSLFTNKFFQAHNFKYISLTVLSVEAKEWIVALFVEIVRFLSWWPCPVLVDMIEVFGCVCINMSPNCDVLILVHILIGAL